MVPLPPAQSQFRVTHGSSTGYITPSLSWPLWSPQPGLLSTGLAPRAAYCTAQAQVEPEVPPRLKSSVSKTRLISTLSQLKVGHYGMPQTPQTSTKPQARPAGRTTPKSAGSPTGRPTSKGSWRNRIKTGLKTLVSNKGDPKSPQTSANPLTISSKKGPLTITAKSIEDKPPNRARSDTKAQVHPLPPPLPPFGGLSVISSSSI